MSFLEFFETMTPVCFINIKMAQCVTAAAQTLSLKNTSTFSIDNIAAEADVVLEQSLFMLGQTPEWDMRWQ